MSGTRIIFSACRSCWTLRHATNLKIETNAGNQFRLRWCRLIPIENPAAMVWWSKERAGIIWSCNISFSKKGRDRNTHPEYQWRPTTRACADEWRNFVLFIRGFSWYIIDDTMWGWLLAYLSIQDIEVIGEAETARSHEWPWIRVRTSFR